MAISPGARKPGICGSTVDVDGVLSERGYDIIEGMNREGGRDK